VTEPRDDQVPVQVEEPNGDGNGEGRRLFADLAGINVDWRSAVVVPLLAVLTALIVGAFIIVLSDLDLLRKFGSDPLGALADSWTLVSDAYVALAKGAFGSTSAWSETLVAATPLIFTGLAVAIGFRAGLFNIGGQGQLIVGAMGALIAGFTFDLPSFLHIPLALIAGTLAGAIWGGAAGLLKARTGAHEVITTIMLNYIALFLMRWALKTEFIRVEGRQDPISKTIETSAYLPRLFGFLDNTQLRVHLGFVLAVVAAWFVYWLLFKSTIGYEFRATGFNPDAARYGGMKVTAIYAMVMAVAGGLAGLGGAVEIQGLHHSVVDGFQGTLGFDAIALALLGRSHPAGVVMASLLFGALVSGGRTMQSQTAVPIDLILVVQALVIMFIAAPALIRAIYRVRTGRATEQLTRGWAS
jgi:general nucleoside transport system permease protein